MLLPIDWIHRLHAALISAGLDEHALLAGIDSRISAQIQRRPSPSQQLLGTLTELSQLGRALDGTVPLEMLLQNAILLAGPRREAVEFEDALRALKVGDRGAGNAGVSPVEVGSPATPKEPSPAIRLFVSHAPEDARFVDLLERHMASMIRSGNLAIWHAGKVEAYEDVQDRIAEEIERADLAVVFLSADYLADDRAAFEMKRVEARMATGKWRVVPILARHFDLQSSPFSRLAALPRDGRPIVRQRDPDEAYVEIVRSVRAIVEGLKKAAGEGRAEQPIVPGSSSSRDFDFGRYPFHLPEAQSLSALLLELTEDLPKIRHLASSAGLAPLDLPHPVTPSQAWSLLLDLASRRGKFEPFIRAVMADPDSASMATLLDRALENLARAWKAWCVMNAGRAGNGAGNMGGARRA